MRIALFTETYRPSVNGVVTRISETVAELRRRGDEVLLVAPDAGVQSPTDALVAVAGFPLPLYPDVSVAFPRRFLRAALTEFRPDLIHAVNPAVLGLAGIHYAHSLGVPLVASFHTHLPRYLRHYRLGPLEPLAWEILRTIHNQADLNLCVSKEAGDELRRRGVRRVEIGWGGGVDTDRFSPQRRNGAMRSFLSAGDVRAPLLLYVGRLSAEKSVETLDSALDALPGSRLALVGDGPHRGVLERHFSGRRVFFAGRLEGIELAAAYASADVFVFPSTTDTLGLVVLEALASGCPAVAAAAGGIPDLIDHGRTGLLYCAADGAGMATQVSRLLPGAPERDAIRQAGRRFAESHGWARATTNLRAHYLRLIRGHRASAA